MPGAALYLRTWRSARDSRRCSNGIMAALEAQRHPKSIICEVTSPATTAPILMHISSPRNNPLLEQNHGSARVQHVDPLRPAPGCRDEPCARGYACAEGEPLPAADSARR